MLKFHGFWSGVQITVEAVFWCALSLASTRFDVCLPKLWAADSTFIEHKKTKLATQLRYNYYNLHSCPGSCCSGQAPMSNAVDRRVHSPVNQEALCVHAGELGMSSECTAAALY